MATQLPAWRFLLLALIGVLLAAGVAIHLAAPVLLVLFGLTP